MSLMFAKQFSEAGVNSTSGKKGGRGKGGSGLMSKSKKGARGRDQDDAGDASGGLFNMDPNAPYRTHMLFPGRKDDDGSGNDPRRSSGSPSFMKAMMSWGKRPSDPRAAAQAQELAGRYSRGTPTKTTPGGAGESEFESDPFSHYRKTVSFHEQNHHRTAGGGIPPPPPSSYNHHHHHLASSPTSSTTSPTTNHTHNELLLFGGDNNSLFANNHHNQQHRGPYKENDYAAFTGGTRLILTTNNSLL